MTPDYTRLERNMLTYRDLIQIPVRENHEPLVVLDRSRLPWQYRPPFTDMKDALGDTMMVRKTVARKLYLAQSRLSRRLSDFSLHVSYGYRSPEVQTARFLYILSTLTATFYADPYELYEAAHRRVAVPTVAGHPTGAAVDITLINRDTGREPDFGSSMYDYSSRKCYVFSPEISPAQKNIRKELRAIMIEAGFAPFDGEWWHFSYGDREWAAYYHKPCAIYDKVSL